MSFMLLLFLKVEEENGIVEKFDWAVEGILLPLVCLVGVFGKIIIRIYLGCIIFVCIM